MLEFFQRERMRQRGGRRENKKEEEEEEEGRGGRKEAWIEGRKEEFIKEYYMSQFTPFVLQSIPTASSHFA